MKAYAKLQNKTESDVEKVVNKFNQWADERIVDIQDLGVLSVELRVDMLYWAKQTLKRFAKEVLAE